MILMRAAGGSKGAWRILNPETVLGPETVGSGRALMKARTGRKRGARLAPLSAPAGAVRPARDEHELRVREAFWTDDVIAHAVSDQGVPSLAATADGLGDIKCPRSRARRFNALSRARADAVERAEPPTVPPSRARAVTAAARALPPLPQPVIVDRWRAMLTDYAPEGAAAAAAAREQPYVPQSSGGITWQRNHAPPATRAAALRVLRALGGDDDEYDDDDDDDGDDDEWLGPPRHRIDEHGAAKDELGIIR